MIRRIRRIAAVIVVVGVFAANGFAFTPDDKGQKNNEQTTGSSSKGKKQHKDYSGKALLGDRITKNGTHKLEDHGKYSASASVFKGKITGMTVKHPDKRSVAVTKYKTTKNMARGATSSVELASYFLVQSQYMRTIWIGYGYTDDWGDDYIYWFPYDMIYDGSTGAIDYYPTYH